MAAELKLTLSVITANPGGYIGHVSSHPDLLKTADEQLGTAQEDGKIIDFHTLRCGSDINLIITHRNGRASEVLNRLAVKTCIACKAVAEELKLTPPEGLTAPHALRGSEIGPGIAELDFIERPSEPVVIFMASRAARGLWNLPLYKILADPFNTLGIVTDPVMSKGFTFEIVDVKEDKKITFSTPEDIYALLALIGVSSRYVVEAVSRRSDRDVASVVSTATLNTEGKRVPRIDNPVMIMRCRDGFPAAGEALESFAFPYLVRGCQRNQHCGPLMPVPFYEANLTRLDGPPRIIAAGFQISSGHLIGPHDMFDDPCFDESRRIAGRVAEYMRRHGPFQPHLTGGEKPLGNDVSPVSDSIHERSGK